MTAETAPTTTPYGRTKAQESITVLDLFAGTGGLTQGVYDASPRYVTERAVESEPAAAASFVATFGNKSIQGRFKTG